MKISRQNRKKKYILSQIQPTSNTSITDQKENTNIHNHFVFLKYSMPLTFFINPIALRKPKIVCNFGLSECNKVKVPKTSNVMFSFIPASSSV